MSEMIATANATRACAKNPPDTGYPVSGGSVILRLYGGNAQRLLFGERLVPDLNPASDADQYNVFFQLREFS